MKIPLIKTRLAILRDIPEIYVSLFTGIFNREILRGSHPTCPKYRSVVAMSSHFVNPQEAYSRVSDDAETNLRVEKGASLWIFFTTFFDKRPYIDYPTTFKLVILFSSPMGRRWQWKYQSLQNG